MMHSPVLSPQRKKLIWSERDIQRENFVFSINYDTRVWLTDGGRRLPLGEVSDA